MTIHNVLFCYKYATHEPKTASGCPKNKKFVVTTVLDSELLHNTEQTLESHGVPTEI